MIKFQQTARTGGDETAPYDVILDREYTVRELINYILTRKEWGRIDIRCAGKQSASVGYKGSKLPSQLPDDIQDRVVVSAKAAGGWSNMNYLIEIG